MDYKEVNFKLKSVSTEERDIVIAMLGYIDYESFSDTKDGLNAYIQINKYNEQLLKETLGNLPFEFDFTTTTIKDQNWNAEWEKNFDPIYVAEQCQIRAPFHSKQEGYEYDLVIEPKMSFGTGHHATTTLMVELMLDINFENKEVLDMGCGTGVLAILASKKQAKKIQAVDIDSWAYENTIENIERNKCTNIKTELGDASALINKSFDVIIANINRNILLNDMSVYVGSLNNGGILALSGFYSQDLPIILEKATEIGLKYEKHIEKDNWIAVKLIRTPN